MPASACLLKNQNKTTHFQHRKPRCWCFASQIAIDGFVFQVQMLEIAKKYLSLTHAGVGPFKARGFTLQPLQSGASQRSICCDQWPKVTSCPKLDWDRRRGAMKDERGQMGGEVETGRGWGALWQMLISHFDMHVSILMNWRRIVAGIKENCNL